MLSGSFITVHYSPLTNPPTFALQLFHPSLMLPLSPTTTAGNNTFKFNSGKCFHLYFTINHYYIDIQPQVKAREKAL
jgi:hypothetical protein